MNWESSRALTPLKRDFLLAFFRENHDFFLTGGSALGIFYLDHRRSYDLDLFTTGTVDWHRVSNLVGHIAIEIAATVTPITEAPFFRRYDLQRGPEREVLDLVVESAPQVDEQKREVSGIRVDTLREIAVNKLAALLGRGEHKDVVDLYFLEKTGVRVPDLLPDARRKDAGLEPALLSWVLSQIRFQSVPEYLLVPVTMDELNGFVDRLRTAFAAESFPRNT